uniref:(northern house mosquito) hypothetical protein n=1 Tax=Culex pipiens TaxID=7175 RepID=A0A8D8JKP0_CULPI
MEEQSFWADNSCADAPLTTEWRSTTLRLSRAIYHQLLPCLLPSPQQIAETFAEKEKGEFARTVVGAIVIGDLVKMCSVRREWTRFWLRTAAAPGRLRSPMTGRRF